MDAESVKSYLFGRPALTPSHTHTLTPSQRQVPFSHRAEPSCLAGDRWNQLNNSPDACYFRLAINVKRQPEIGSARFTASPPQAEQNALAWGCLEKQHHLIYTKDHSILLDVTESQVNIACVCVCFHT